MATGLLLACVITVLPSQKPFFLQLSTYQRHSLMIFLLFYSSHALEPHNDDPTIYGLMAKLRLLGVRSAQPRAKRAALQLVIFSQTCHGSYLWACN